MLQTAYAQGFCMTGAPPVDLAQIVDRSRRLYAARVAGTALAPQWWTAVLITAGSQRQAEKYEWELRRRVAAGRIPDGVLYMVVPDVADKRIGSGGATLNAIRRLIAGVLLQGDGANAAIDLRDWWSQQRVLLIHSGGDSRRLPQYSVSGKLFSAVPVMTPWGEASTVFDEVLALSSDWAERIPSGLVVGSGDVILTFDAQAVNCERPGFSGVAILQPAETGARHGVYVIDRGDWSRCRTTSRKTGHRGDHRLRRGVHRTGGFLRSASGCRWDHRHGASHRGDRSRRRLGPRKTGHRGDHRLWRGADRGSGAAAIS